MTIHNLIIVDFHGKNGRHPKWNDQNQKGTCQGSLEENHSFGHI